MAAVLCVRLLLLMPELMNEADRVHPAMPAVPWPQPPSCMPAWMEVRWGRMNNTLQSASDTNEVLLYAVVQVVTLCTLQHFGPGAPALMRPKSKMQ